MIGYVTIGHNDLDKACAFYDAVFAPLGYGRTFREGTWAGFGPGGRKEGLEIYLASPQNERPATFGNGSMLAFKADSRAAVDAFHEAALGAGGSSEGAPGVRGDYEPAWYGAYVRDPSGNKLAAYFQG
jgi:catechol 2,3-dioxygenase-like lactoylglutathione lyase family enzyme